MAPGRKEWDRQLLKTCFYDHDIEEICRIRLSNAIQEDTIAWHYEPSGIFSVRSAYRLAVSSAQGGNSLAGSSRAADGNRSAYTSIWSAQVSPKVRIFA
jgi:hypothetical protein